MDGHDLPVGDVRVDVTRDEERQQHDREMEGDGQPERESHRDLAAPRGPQQHQEPDRPRGHAQYGRDRESRPESIQPDGLRDPDERAARLGARREDRLQRGSGDRGDDGLDQEAGHGRRDGGPGHPSPRCLHIAADASTGPALGCTTWRDSARAPAPAWSSRSARSAMFSLFAWVLVFLLWIALSIYAIVEWIGDGRPSALAVLLIVVLLVGGLVTLAARRVRTHREEPDAQEARPELSVLRGGLHHHQVEDPGDREAS